MPAHDDARRRAYWAEQMQLGYDLVRRVLQFDVRDCGEGLASLIDAAESAGVEMMFSDTKIAGELERLHFIREGLVQPLLAAARQMNERGWILKIEDGYRTQQMQRSLGTKPEVFRAILSKCAWENSGRLPPMDVIFRRATVLVANIPKMGTHLSASAVDVSVFQREDGAEVWRGGPYLEMSERTPMRSPFIDPDQLANRLEITEILERYGFVHFPYEFWHFNQQDAMGHVLTGKPGPARYGPVHWDPATNRVEPYDDPLQLLNPLDVLEREVERWREASGEQ